VPGNWNAGDGFRDVIVRHRGAAIEFHNLARAKAMADAARRAGDRAHAGGRFMTGDYRVVADQPPDDVLRDTTRWRAWATEQVAALTAGRRADPWAATTPTWTTTGPCGGLGVPHCECGGDLCVCDEPRRGRVPGDCVEELRAADDGEYDLGEGG
jgi:hypothetical protein